MAINGWIIERTVDLAHPPKTLRNEQPYEITYTGDVANPVWTVHVLQDGQPVALGGSVKAYIKRIDGAEVVSNGTISGNTVTVELGGSNFGKPGYTWGILRYTDSTTNATITLDALSMLVQTDPEGTSVLDPDDMLPTLPELLAELDDMRDATAAAEAVTESIADNYSTSNTYAVGDYVLYNGGLYRCKTAITTAETWTAAHWTQVSTFGAEVTECSKYRGSLSGENPTTASVKIGTYVSQKKQTSSGYPDDMVVGHYCIIQYLSLASGNRYFLVFDDGSGEIWFYKNGSYKKIALNDAIEAINDLIEDIDAEIDDCSQYRGGLSGDNPITASVKIGVYASQKKSTSTGYPDDMIVNHYCIIQYLALASGNRYFLVFDDSTGEIWFYRNGSYKKIALNDSLENMRRTYDSIFDVLDGNVARHGTPVVFDSDPYKIIASNGSITTMSETTANAKWKVSEEITVAPGDIYILTLGMFYNNGIIAFYDENDTALMVVKADVGEKATNKYTVTGYAVTAPETASYMRIGFYLYDDITMSVLKLTEYTLIERRFVGKKWACIGDSLTYPGTLRASKKYYDYIQERTGITFVNLGKSGTGYVNDYNGAGTFISRVDDIPDDTDVVTLFGSGNDLNFTPSGSANPIPVGTADDTTNSTIMGAVYLTIQEIFTEKPHVLLGIIAPTPWVQYPPYTADNKMLTFVTELEKLCKKYSIPFLDLYHNSNLRPWDETFRQNYYSKDDGNGVHPDENGNKRFAPMIQDFLERMLLSN